MPAPCDFGAPARWRGEPAGGARTTGELPERPGAGADGTTARLARMSHPLRWDPELTKVRSGISILRDPLRTALAAAAIVLAIGSLLPWAEGFIGFLAKRFGGFDGASDGLILFVLAALLLFIARDPGFLSAPDGARRWTPLTIGLVCFGIWLIGRQQAEFEIGRWVDQGGRGALAPGFYVAGIGAIGVAAVGSFASLRRRAGEVGGPASLLRLPRRSDVPTLATAIGALIGLGVAVGTAVSLFPPVGIGGILVFFAGFGIIAGMYVGRTVGRWIGGGPAA